MGEDLGCLKELTACDMDESALCDGLGNRTLDSHLRKLGADDDSDEDGEYDEQSERASSAFAEQMQDYMRDEAVSQTELGTQIGLRQQQISRWIFGKGTTATRQAVERRVRAWLKKRGVSLQGGLPSAVSFLTRSGKKNRAAKPTAPHAVFDATTDGEGRSSRERGFRELEA